MRGSRRPRGEKTKGPPTPKPGLGDEVGHFATGKEWFIDEPSFREASFMAQRDGPKFAFSVWVGMRQMLSIAVKFL